MSKLKFKECAHCAQKSGWDMLCPSCINNRICIESMSEANENLQKAIEEDQKIYLIALKKENGKERTIIEPFESLDEMNEWIKNFEGFFQVLAVIKGKVVTYAEYYEGPITVGKYDIKEMNEKIERLSRITNKLATMIRGVDYM